MLRTCNVLRIASVPVLRNDELFNYQQNVSRTHAPRNQTSKPPQLFTVHC
ncbi:MAG: hypothetical protein LBM98_02235 [Oscillospiraceae bacterium]|nr:hypothetical protein [Oscillospiraceae bacterium]